jgi:hypothetical protein
MLLDVHVQHQKRDALGEVVSDTSWNSHNCYAVLENIGLYWFHDLQCQFAPARSVQQLCKSTFQHEWCILLDVELQHRIGAALGNSASNQSLKHHNC